MLLDWSPSRYTPFAHQLEDTQAVVDHPFFFIASEMRTGKTKIVIDAAQFLFFAGVIDRVIVICPEPVRGVWVGADSTTLGGELHEHLWLKTPTLVTEFHSKINQWRVGPAGPELRFIVSNYEFIRPYKRKDEAKKNDKALQKLLKYCTPKTLFVLDESGAVTSHNSEQFESCFAMRQKCGRVVLMNGTPMDTPIHLFAQGRMMHDSIIGTKFITHFKRRYAKEEPVISARTGKQVMTPYNKGVTKIVGWKNLEDLQARFKPFTVRRLQADCPDMPTKLPAVTLKATMSTEWPFYVSMRDDMLVMLEGSNASISQQAIVKFMRLTQITGGFLGGIQDSGLDPPCVTCGGSGYIKQDMCADCEGSGIGAAQPLLSSVREVGRSKLDVLLWLLTDLLTKDPHIKIVIWARFVHETQRILREVAKKFPDGVLVVGLFGGQPKHERDFTKAMLHPLTAPKDMGVVSVGTIGTGSFGLDFSAARVSINYSYDHSLRKFLQSGDRVYGPRQVAPIEYFDIVAVGPKGQKTYDSVIVQARRDKQDLATWTTDAWVKALKEPAASDA